jgi:hypothetical protein
MFAALVYTVSFGNHLTMITLLPAILYFVYAVDRKMFLDRRMIVTVVGFIFIGALQYGYLFWRTYAANVPYLETQTPDFLKFLKVVSGGGFKHKMFKFSALEILLERIPMYAQLIWHEFYFFILFVIYGFYRLRDHVLKNFLLLAFLGNVAFALDYKIPDIAVFFIPGYLVLFIFLAYGIRSVLDSLPEISKLISVFLLATFPLFLLVKNYADVDQSLNVREANEAQAIFNHLDNEAVLLTSYKYSQFYWYYLLEQNPKKKRIYIIRLVDFYAVGNYMEGAAPLYIKEMRCLVPYGLPVYCTTWPLRKRLMEMGFGIEKFRRNVYRVHWGAN